MFGNLPKGLLESVTKKIQKDAQDNAVFEAMLAEYGCSDPVQLSEEQQDEFWVLGCEVLGEAYVGFNKLKRKIAGRGGVKNAGAIAASIGRKKYGKAKFQKDAAAGKKMRGEKSLREDWADRQKEKERDKERRSGRKEKEESKAPKEVKEESKAGKELEHKKGMPSYNEETIEEAQINHDGKCLGHVRKSNTHGGERGGFDAAHINLPNNAPSKRTTHPTEIEAKQAIYKSHGVSMASEEQIVKKK